MISITSTDCENGRNHCFISIIAYISWNHAENHKVKTNTPSDFQWEYATLKAGDVVKKLDSMKMF